MKEPTKVIYQQVMSSGTRGLPKIKLIEFSGDTLQWPEWSGLFSNIIHQAQITDIEKLQYLKTGLTDLPRKQSQEWDTPLRRFIVPGKY